MTEAEHCPDEARLKELLVGKPDPDSEGVDD